jgi:hypothetical protein
LILSFAADAKDYARGMTTKLKIKGPVAEVIAGLPPPLEKGAGGI